MNSIKFSTVGTVCLVYGTGTCLMLSSLLFFGKITWLNKKPYVIKELSSDTGIDNYSIQNVIDQDEVLVCITKNELEKMSLDEKAKLLEMFIVDENVFETCELSSEQIKHLRQLTFKECVDNSIPLYLSCIPNINDGTFTVKYFRRDLNHLYKIKFGHTIKYRSMCILGAVASYILAIGIAVGSMQ